MRWSDPSVPRGGVVRAKEKRSINLEGNLFDQTPYPKPQSRGTGQVQVSSSSTSTGYSQGLQTHPDTTTG